MSAFSRLWPVGSSFVVVLTAGLSAGCVVMDDGEKSDKGDGPQSETVTWSSPADDTGSESLDLPSVSVSWGVESVMIDVAGGGSWQLGLAETGGSCGADVPCWTGEDCHLGYVATDGTAYGPYCHTISEGLLELTYGGNLTDLAPGTTVFQEAFAETVSYVVLPLDGSLPCLTFGDDPDYFAGLDCVELSL